jgi:hypothetical protein
MDSRARDGSGATSHSREQQARYESQDLWTSHALDHGGTNGRDTRWTGHALERALEDGSWTLDVVEDGPSSWTHY